MKIRMRMLIMSLALALSGLTFSACDKEEAAPSTDEAVEESALEEEEEEAAADEEDEEEEAREYDEDMYILAAYEVSCVNAEVKDPTKAGEIKGEIYARYGFEDADDFAKAEEELGKRDTVQRAVDARMEECTEELALSFAEAGAEPEAAEEEAKEEEAKKEAAKPAAQKPARKTPAVTGRLQGTTSGSGIDDGKVTLQVRADFNVRGTVAGSREGRAFSISVNGKADEHGGFTATGSRDGNTVNLRGRLSSSGATGDVTGQIFQNDVRVSFQARK